MRPLFYVILCLLALTACKQNPQVLKDSNTSEYEFLPDGVFNSASGTPRLKVSLALYKDSLSGERKGKVGVAWSDQDGGSHLTGTVSVKLRQAGQSSYLSERDQTAVDSIFMAPTIVLTSGTKLTGPLCVEVTDWNLSSGTYTFNNQRLPLVYCHKNMTETGADVAIELDVNSEAQVTVNQTFPLVLAIQNLGKEQAKDTVITLNLPPALEFISDNSLGFDCTLTSENQVKCLRFENKALVVSRWGLPIMLRGVSETSKAMIDISIATSSIDPQVSNNSFTQSIVINPVSLCPTSVETNQSFECQLPAGSTTYALSNAPVGMVVQPKSGLIRWTPSKQQTGSYQITTNLGDFNLTVNSGNSDPIGIYVSHDGNDANNGSITTPLKTVQAAVKKATPGVTIFVRGGTYFNPDYGKPFDTTRKSNAITKITVSGTATQPITLRPHGNEFVKLTSDESGLVFDTVNYWVVDGLELEGSAKSLNYDTAMSDWWADDNSRTSGRGIVNNDSQHITVRNCIIHDFPGAGVGSNGADFVTVENNIIYNNGWWTTAGTHGVANSYLTTTDSTTADQEKLVMEGNLVFGNQSLIISHVFSKGFVSLTIDEGNGLHAQNNRKTFQGKARVENNLLLFNGKAGFGINTMDQVIVKNNAFYQNARVVENAGELILQTSNAEDISNNLFMPRTNRRTIKDSTDAYTNVFANATVASSLDSDLPSSVLHDSAVFQNPSALDFRPVAGLESMGVPEGELLRMFSIVDAYGIQIKSPIQEVNTTYMHEMKQYIFDNWPASYSTLRLIDEETGFEFTYAQRCQYPAAPSSDSCP